MLLRRILFSCLLLSIASASYAYRIHPAQDTVFVHAKRGAIGYTSVVIISSRRGEDTATFVKQGWDTLRASLNGSAEFSFEASWENEPIPFYGDRLLYLTYSPTSLAGTQATLTVVGDSNTISVVFIGIPDTNSACARLAFGKTASIAEGASTALNDTVFNLSTSAIQIDSATTTSPANFAFPGSFPMTVAAQSYVLLPVQESMPSPATSSYAAGNVTLWITGLSNDNVPCASATSYVGINLLIPIDTIVLDLPPQASDTVTLNVSAAISEHMLVFRNATSGGLFVSDVQITDTSKSTRFLGNGGPHCRYGHLANDYCLHDSVAAGHTTDTIPFYLTEQQGGTYFADFAVNYANALTSQSYTFRTVYSAKQASVSNATVTRFDFSVYPNPAQNSVTVSLPEDRVSTVDIFDILGHSELRTEATGTCEWHADAAGSYIVRVSTRLPDGSLAVSSKRLIIDK